MRNISFSLTTQQIRDRSKTVTRRLGWKTLEPGTLLQPVVKGMGLKKGERIEKIGGPILVVGVRRERLARLVYESNDWGRREVVAEGFPEMTRFEFFGFFSKTHGAKSCDQALKMEVTRIEFEYVEVGEGRRMMEKKHARGFAGMDRDAQREIASKGGRAAHQQGTAHQWSSEEAREAGRKGGRATRSAQQSDATADD